MEADVEPKQSGGAAAGGPGRSAEPPEGRQPKKRRRLQDVQDRMLLYVIRGLFFLIAAGIGLYASKILFPEEAVWTILCACGVGLILLSAEVFFFSRARVRALAAISIGLITGLVLSLVLQPVIELIVNAAVSGGQDVQAEKAFRESISWIVQLATTSAFCYLGIAVLLQTKDDFKFIIPYVEFRKDVRGHTPLILDTSAIIDGRVCDLLETRILDQRLLVPRFVLNELQNVADSGDRSLRERGRRGMDLLHEIRRRFEVEIVERDAAAAGDVDRELLALAEEHGGKLLTTDFNLQKRARLQGVTVININDLATALKPIVVPGEELRVRLLREGDAPGQAVGFLGDGTMVVVENSSRRIGQEIAVEVTSTTQTSAGKMVFGRPRGGPPMRRHRRRQPSRPRGEEPAPFSAPSGPESPHELP